MRQRAAVRMADAEQGHFPQVCVVTGETATGIRAKTLSVSTTSSDWSWPLLLVFGLFIFIVSRFAWVRTITIDLPVGDTAGSLWRVGGHIDGDWLWLSGVHPNFARALGQQYAELDESQLPNL